MARRSARQMADMFYPPLSVTESDTWKHPVDYSLPKRGLAEKLRRLMRRRDGGRK